MDRACDRCGNDVVLDIRDPVARVHFRTVEAELERVWHSRVRSISTIIALVTFIASAPLWWRFADSPRIAVKLVPGYVLFGTALAAMALLEAIGRKPRFPFLAGRRFTSRSEL